MKVPRRKKSSANCNTNGYALNFKQIRNELGDNNEYVIRDVPISSLDAKNYGPENHVDPTLAQPSKGPIVLNSDWKIVDGRHRTALAAQNGQETIPAYVPRSVAGDIDAGKPGPFAAQEPDTNSVVYDKTTQSRTQKPAGTLSDALAGDLGPERTDAGRKSPILHMIKQIGGIHPDSDIAGEVRQAYDKSVPPGLFRRGAGTTGLDNVVASEMRARLGLDFMPPHDANGYVDRGWLLDQMRNEAHGQPITGAGGRGAAAADVFRDIESGKQAGSGPISAGRAQQAVKLGVPRPKFSKKTTDPTIYWHGGTDLNDLRGGSTGLHLGTKEAARQALNARIGVPATGEWDGTKEYGKTLLAGRKTLDRIVKEEGRFVRSGFNVDAPEEDYYPLPELKYQDGTELSYSSKPDIKPFKLNTEMTNSRQNPHPDFKANGYMKAQIKRGGGKRGFYYKNEGEDSGSISVVVPNGSHITPVDKPAS